MTVKRVWIVRHGETAWNAEQRWQGNIASVSLNAIGYEQAEALAAHVRGQPIDVIYSSDLLRAIQTANVVAKSLKIDVKLDERLQEVNFGVLQGLTRHDILQRYPHEYQSIDSDWNHVIPEGESQIIAQNRMFEAWQILTTRSPHQEIMIVSHGRAIKLLLLKLCDNMQDIIASARFPNTSFTILERHYEQWRLVELASVVHLNV